MHNPSKDYMNVVFWILHYLKSSLGRGLMFRKHNHLSMKGYSDADWAGGLDRKSTSRYFTFVVGTLLLEEVKNRR